MVAASARPRFGCVLFDFDYTLADSSTAAVECINFALLRLGLSPVSHTTACRTIGLSLSHAFRALTQDHSREKARMFSHHFLVRANEVMVPMTNVFTETTYTIRRLRSSGRRLGIVSTKDRYMIERILDRSALASFFEVILGGEDVTLPKPDPQGVNRALAILENSPATSLYVGDSVVDAETALRAGVPFVAVLTGTTPREAFSRYSPYGIVQRLSEVPDLL